MKTLAEILNLINTKIEEHRKEVEGATQELETLKKVTKAGIEPAMKQLVLKDKIMFHKACGMALNDLKDAIK